MNSSQLFDLIETIAASPKKTDKERLLKEADCPELRRVLVATYNPRINYYIKKVHSTQSKLDGECFDAQTYHTLDMFSSRQWTGNEALEQLKIELENLNPKSKELLSRIIKRDLRCGINVSSINKVFKDLIPETPYMRCSLLSKVDTSKWDWQKGVFSQTKFDGMFCNVTVLDGIVLLTSRQGSEFPIEEFVDLAEHMLEFAEVGNQYHGELLVIDPNGNVLPREIGNGLLNSVLKGGTIPAGHYAKFIAWDMVELDVIEGKKKCDKEYWKRLRQLNQVRQSEVFEVSKTRILHSLDEAYLHYQELLDQDQEGSIIKNPNMLWRDGTSKDQLKLKLEFEVDLKITGFTQGNGKNANTFGSISMESSDGLVKVDVSGMPDDLRMYAHLHREELLDTIASVKANDITKSNPASLYLPRLVEFRLDKTVADSFEQIVEQRENAKKGIK